MKRRELLARAQALLSRVLMLMAVRILGPLQADWGRAIRAEAASFQSEREALDFAWGCFAAALRYSIGHAVASARAGMAHARHAGSAQVQHAGVAQAQHAGVLSGSAAVLMGCFYMHRAGAPNHYVWMNPLSLALAIALFRAMPRRRLQTDATLRAKVAFALGAALLAAALLQPATQASSWLRLGPVQFNLTWLVMPALLVAADVRSRSSARTWAVGALVMAVSALSLLGDALLIGLTAVVLSVLALRRRQGAWGLLALVAWAMTAHLSSAWRAPEASMFVDEVVRSGFDASLVMGLALALLQVLPLWLTLRQRPSRLHGLVWGLLVALSLPGWLPSPLVGFGGSFIVAYLLSLALMAGDNADGSAERTTLTRRSRPWPSSDGHARVLRSH